MNSICLSVAPNLRCEGLTRTENIILIVPPAIELIFSITLALTNASDRGRKHWLLVLDGVVFFILALLDFLSHIITEASSTLVIFKIIDFVLAAASFLPILAYTLFLFLFARSNLVTLLPTRFRRVMTVSLFAVIPPILVFNELGSLLGISHRAAVSPITNKPVLVVGFTNTTVSLFFSAGTLVLLALFQVGLFTLGFVRLVRAFLDERRVESTNNEQSDGRDEIHLFRGLAWLVAGLKLSAVESVVGFANISFGVVVTRRVLRMFGRGMLIVGVIKGMNVIEDFMRFESEVRERRGNSTRRSKRFSRFMISNPRNSTFREMSPQASSFHAAQREKKAGRIGPSPLALGANSTLNAFDGPTSKRKERVTVIYDGKTPPVLEMRFSQLDMPIPPLPVQLSLPVVEEEPQDHRNQVYQSAPTSYPAKAPVPKRDTLPPATISTNSLPRSTMSGSMRTPSVASDSLEAVREIASRFPGLPPRVIPGRSPLAQPQAALDPDPDEDWRSVSRSRSLQRRRDQGESTARTPTPGSTTATVSPGNSLKRKPAPGPPEPPRTAPEPEPIPDAGDIPSMRTYALESEYASVMPQSPDSSDDGYSAHMTPTLTRVSTLDTAPTTPGSFPSMPAERPLGRLANRVMAIETKLAQTRQADADAASEEGQDQRLARLRRELRASNVDSDASPMEGRHSEGQVEIPWLHNDPLSELQNMGRKGYPLVPDDVNGDEDEAVLDEAWRRAGLTRIKSVSQVRVHTTPLAEQTDFVRGSLFAVEEEDLGLPESFEEPRNLSVASASLGRHARLDSGVLGEEDRRLVRQGIYV